MNKYHCKFVKCNLREFNVLQMAQIPQKPMLHGCLNRRNYPLIVSSLTLSLCEFFYGDCRHWPEEGFLKSRSGTPVFMAPEVIMQEYGALCDEWSVGRCFKPCICTRISKPPTWCLHRDMFHKALTFSSLPACDYWPHRSRSSQELGLLLCTLLKLNSTFLCLVGTIRRGPTNSQSSSRGCLLSVRCSLAQAMCVSRYDWTSFQQSISAYSSNVQWSSSPS